MKVVTQATLQTAYKRYAKFYDFVFGKIFHPGRTEALRQLNLKDGDRVLEVGVGTGLSLELYPPTVRVVGIDLSKEMLAKAKSRAYLDDLKHVESLEIMDAQEMTFPDKSFDKIVAMYVASVVPDPKKFIEELRRVVKPGGMIILLNHFENPRAVVRLMEKVGKPMAWILGFHPVFPLEKFIKDTGFVIDRQIAVGLLDNWTILVGH